MPSFRKLPWIGDLKIGVHPFPWWRNYFPYITGNNIVIVLEVICKNGPEKPEVRETLLPLLKLLTAQRPNAFPMKEKTIHELTYLWKLYRWDGKDKNIIDSGNETFSYIEGRNQELIVSLYQCIGGKYLLEMEFTGPYFQINPKMKTLTMAEFQILEKDEIIVKAYWAIIGGGITWLISSLINLLSSAKPHP